MRRESILNMHRWRHKAGVKTVIAACSIVPCLFMRPASLPVVHPRNSCGFDSPASGMMLISRAAGLPCREARAKVVVWTPL